MSRQISCAEFLSIRCELQCQGLEKECVEKKSFVKKVSFVAFPKALKREVGPNDWWYILYISFYVAWTEIITKLFAHNVLK